MCILYHFLSSPLCFVCSFHQVLPKSHPCHRQTRLFRFSTQFQIQFLLAQWQWCWKTGSETRVEHEVWTREAKSVRYKTGMRRDPVNKPLGYSLMLTLASSQASTQQLSRSSFSAEAGEKKWWKSWEVEVKTRKLLASCHHRQRNIRIIKLIYCQLK